MFSSVLFRPSPSPSATPLLKKYFIEIEIRVQSSLKLVGMEDFPAQRPLTCYVSGRLVRLRAASRPNVPSQCHIYSPMSILSGFYTCPVIFGLVQPRGCTNLIPRAFRHIGTGEGDEKVFSIVSFYDKKGPGGEVGGTLDQILVGTCHPNLKNVTRCL